MQAQAVLKLLENRVRQVSDNRFYLSNAALMNDKVGDEICMSTIQVYVCPWLIDNNNIN